MAKPRCIICDQKEDLGHVIVKLPATLIELGYEGEYAGVQCVLRERNRQKELWERRGFVPRKKSWGYGK